MIEIILLGIFLSLLCYLYKEGKEMKNPAIPPGPFKYPFFGNLFQICSRDSLPHRGLAKLAKTYGDIMSIKIGVLDAVVVSSYEGMRDLMPHPKLIARISDGVIRDRNMGKNLGINWSNGETWVKMRTFTVKTLREFGFGKSNPMERAIHAELGDFIQVFSKMIKDNSGVISMDNIFDLTGVNIMLGLMTGKRLDHDDPKLQQLFQLSSDSDKATNLASSPTIAFPFLRILFPNLTGRTVMLQASQKLYQFVRDLMRKHRERTDYTSNPKSFVDKFLSKIDEDSKKRVAVFTEDQFIITCLDMIQGGSDPISNMLNFAILYMLRHPQVQLRVQQEIDTFVPKSTFPQLEDKENLVYTQATILEIYRFGMVLPIPAPRQVTADFYYRGYLFKKDTAVMMNLYSVFRDAEFWNDPETFRPDRFLDSVNNKINPVMKERILAFGLGSRNCPADRLAECSIYLYFTALLQKFRFEAVPGEDLPSMEPVLGMTMSPHPYSAFIQIRE